MQSDSVGVERRRLPFTLIENIVLEDQDLGPVDILVYIALAKHADSDGVCWPSMATLAKLARCARETVARSISRLEARGYLKRTPRFRPDGGVTSNAYQLMPIEVKRYPPVIVDDTPYDLGSHPPVIQDHTNYIQSERDPMKGEALARSTQPSRRPAAPLSTSQPEDQVLRELADIIGLTHDRRFHEGARRLLAEGKAPEEIARVVRSAARDPQERGGLSFIADRFPRWVRKALEQERLAHQRSYDEAVRVERPERERQLAEERVRVLEDRESAMGKRMVAEACARLPWKR
jgi:hypothetical protein